MPRRPSLPGLISQRGFERLLWILALVAVVGIAVAEAKLMTATTTVRVVARVNEENGKIEFGLQQLEPTETGAEWGDRILPHARFFPENAEPGKWLGSTALFIESSAHFTALGCYANTSAFLSCHGFDELSDIDAIEWEHEPTIWSDYFKNYCLPTYLGQEHYGAGGEHSPDVLGWTLDQDVFASVGSISQPWEFGRDYGVWTESPNTRAVYAVRESGDGGSKTVFFQCRVAD